MEEKNLEFDDLIKQQLEFELGFKKPEYFTFTADEKLSFIQPCFSLINNFYAVKGMFTMFSDSLIFLACALLKYGDTEYNLDTVKLQEKVDIVAKFDFELLYKKYCERFPDILKPVSDFEKFNMLEFIKNNAILVMKGYVMLKAGRLPDMSKFSELTWQFFYSLLKHEEINMIDGVFERLHVLLGTKWNTDEIKRLVWEKKSKKKKKIGDKEIFIPLSLIIRPDLFEGLGFEEKALKVPKEESKNVMDANKQKTKELIGKFMSLTG